MIHTARLIFDPPYNIISPEDQFGVIGSCSAAVVKRDHDHCIMTTAFFLFTACSFKAAQLI